MGKRYAALDIIEHLELFDLAKPATPCTWTAGIGLQAPTVDPDRRFELHRLSREVHAISDIRFNRVDAVESASCPATTSQQITRYEALTVFSLATKRHDQEMSAIGCRHMVGGRSCER